MLAVAACGGGGAEPGALRSATLVLDFSPNAVHAGIYSALRRDYYRDEGLELRVREPTASTDAPKLLRTGRAELAILDIHDLGLARERGLDVVGVAGIVQRPLASVLAREDGPIDRPRDLEGKRAGVTGLPSDDAVLDSELKADGGDPEKVKRVTIGFNSVSALAGRKVDGATAFWSAEGVALERSGVPVREFRVDDYGAPPYPELVLTTSRELLDRDPELVRDAVRATVRGYELTLEDPEESLADLAASVHDLDRGLQAASLRALLPVLRPAGELDASALRAWARWDVKHGILRAQPELDRLFEPLS
jgi:NitT/TauT family transport system substrate-binding protein/putative hydroxymethylpyrimidine transport system substrate-binding protein